MENLFLKAVGKKDTVTANGAISNSSTGKAIIDQFGSITNYMKRMYGQVCEDQETIWKENADLALKFIFYLRMITRKVKVNKMYVTEKIQTGQGLKDESLKRLLWLAENHKDVFNRNIWLLPVVGSWKDVWTLMFYDNVHIGTNVINHKVIFELLKQGLASEEHCDLVKKFMPRIKSSSKLKTDWTNYTNTVAKEFAEYIGVSVKDYNILKASGTAHDFQKLISNRMFDNINWSHVPGRALTKLVDSKFLKNNNLEGKFMEWLDKQPTTKFTGYVYELGNIFRESIYNNSLSLVKKVTLNKQFDHLIKIANENGGIQGNVWCALDTSGSMGWDYGNKIRPIDVCTSLGVFFSTLNKGTFHKNVIMFDDVSRVKQLNGDFCDMLSQIPSDSMGGTNFQSVVDEIVSIRQNNPNIPLEDYPQTLLIVSDMEFNPSGTSWRYGARSTELSNHEAMVAKLKTVFPHDFVDSMKFIWWNVSAKTTQFPATMDDGGCYMLSGFDGSVISLILGEKEDKKVEQKHMTMEEIVVNALNQEILLQATLETNVL